MTFQLTASQGGWRIADAPVAPYVDISTHSLTRRLTDMASPNGRIEGISTHSLTRRLTASERPWTRTWWTFQLTASQGGWQPAKTAFFDSGYFNSQPHKEADVKAQSLTKTLMTFQLTASQGGWHRRDDPVLPLPAISTHSLTRRLTALMECMILTILISTHSLTRRLTNTTYTSQIYMTISTHSLTRRLTGNQAEFDRRVQISTHSLTRRLTNFRNSNGA